MNFASFEQYMFMVLTSWFFWHCFQVREYEGYGGAISHGHGHKKCRVKVFVIFCCVDGRNGSQSRFVDVEPVLGTLASTQSCSSSQIYSQCSTSAEEKNDHGLATKSSNKTLSFFLGTLIHVGIILTILIWNQYHSKKLILVSVSKNTFFTFILS